MKKLFGLILIFGLMTSWLIAQEYNPELYISNDKNGLVSFATKDTGPDDFHFYIFGSGYYSFMDEPTHQFNASNYNDSTSVYMVRPYKPTKPPKRSVAPKGDGYKWYGDKTNGKVTFAGDIEVKESWAPAAHTDNEHFYMLVFENKNNEMADGCVEFHYNSNDLFINPAEIMIYHNWVYNQTISPSTDIDYDTKISWNFDTLKYGEQRVIYLPTNVLATTGSIIPRIAKYFDNCTGMGTISGTTTSEVQLYPHDPNFKHANISCLIENLPTHQAIEYTIQFHNDGQYYAEDVYVADVLPLELDLSTFVFLGSKDTCTFNINPTTRTLLFEFNDIFLPGLNQVTNGQTYTFEETISWAKFIISAVPNIPSNHCIVNEAAVVFDTQPVFYTPPSRICASGNCLCDPCETDWVLQNSTTTNPCCISLDVNLTDDCGLMFSKIVTEIVTPGVSYANANVGTSYVNDWTVSTTTNTTIREWIPTGTPAFMTSYPDLINFCLDNPSGVTPQQVNVHYVIMNANGQDVIACTKTFFFQC